MYLYSWTLLSVFPKDKNIVLHNHRTMINSRKFNIAICFLYNLSYSSFISQPNELFYSILSPSVRDLIPALQLVDYCNTNTVVCCIVSLVTERGSWSISAVDIPLATESLVKWKKSQIRSWLHLISFSAHTY